MTKEYIENFDYLVERMYYNVLELKGYIISDILEGYVSQDDVEGALNWCNTYLVTYKMFENQKEYIDKKFS